MVYFPNCKINIGLRILSKRADGFHNLETIFYPVGIKDAVEVIQDNSLKETIFSSTGNPVSGNVENNLCIRAYAILKKDFPTLPYCRIHLHKAIPERAGLGGGSADASFMLQLLNDKFDLQLGKKRLMEYSMQLGSDCPFFILNEPSLAKGRGEILEPFALDLSAYRLLIVNPGIAIETGKAFSKIKLPASPPSSLKERIQQPIQSWKETVINDFEEPVFNEFPEIGAIKESLYKAGALYASLSGSGSSVYGIFSQITDPQLPASYYKKWI